MKQFTTYLSKIWRLLSKHEHTHVILDRRLTVGSPSELTAKIKQKDNLSPSCLLLASYLPLTRHRQLRYAVVILLLTIGVGNVWGDTYTGTFTKITSTDDFTTGYYVIVASEDAATKVSGSMQYNTDYALGNAINKGKRVVGVSVTITSGTTITNPSEDIVYYITKSGSNYTFQNYSTSKYLTQSGNDSGGGMGFSDDASNFTISGYNSNSPKGFKFTLNGESNNIFKYNNQSMWFANYTGDYTVAMTPVRLFKLSSSCSADPTVGAASVNGSFNLSSVGVRATGWAAGINCSWEDYGFVWGTSANPTVDNNKVQVGHSGTATTWNGTLTGSFTVGTTYHFRAYGKNGKDGAAYQYSDDATFTPRQVSFNMHGHGGDAPANQIVNNGGKVTDPDDPSEAGWTFDGWYNNDSYTGSVWNFGTNTVSDGNVTLHAKWTEKPKYTITLNAGNGTVSTVGWDIDGDVWKQQQVNGDASITFPSASSNCAGWEFVGWATSAANNVNSDPTSKAAGATLVPASDVTYYAVYQQSAPSGTSYDKITSTGDLTTGNYMFVSSSNYAMENGVSGSHMTETSGFTSSNSTQTTSSSDLIWTIIKFGSQVAIKNGTNYLGIDGDNNICLSTTPHLFTYTYNTTNSRWEFTSASKTTYQLTYSGSPLYYRMATSQSSAIYLYKQRSNPSGNFYTSPSCTSITVNGVANPAAGGSVSLSATAAKNGDVVYAYASPNSGYKFMDWEKSGAGAVLSDNEAQLTEITIGTADVMVTANFGVLRSITLTGSGTVENGTISADKSAACAGETVTLTATPDTHYSLGSWTVTKTGDPSTTVTVTDGQFTMPDYNITVNATMLEDAYRMVVFKNDGVAAFNDGGDASAVDATNKWKQKIYVGEAPVWPTKLTDVTDACDATSNKFYGWATNTWSDVLADADALDAWDGGSVYTSGPLAPVAAGTGDVVYHAVWAEGEGTTPVLPTTIAYWAKTSFDGANGVNATTGTGTLTSNVSLSTSANRTYQSTISKNAIMSITGIDISSYSHVRLSFWARGSAGGTISIKTNLSETPIATTSALTGAEVLYSVDNIPNTATSITLTYSASSGSFFFGTVKLTEINTTTYSFTELTETNTVGWSGGDWDGYYLITNSQATLKALDGNAIGEKSYVDVTASDGKITNSILNAFQVTYNSTEEKYSVKGIGDNMYLATASNSVSTAAAPGASSYHTINYNRIDNSASSILTWNSSGSKFGFYSAKQTAYPTLYKILTSYTKFRVSCCATKVTLTQNDPTNGAVAFNKSTAGTCREQEVTMTITPSAGYQLTGFSVASGDGKVAASNTEPAVATNNNSSAAQNITLTFVEGANGNYDVTAEFGLMTATAWSWTYNGAAIPNPINLYVGQSASLVATYEPSGNELTSTAKNYNVVKTDGLTYVSKTYAVEHPTYTFTASAEMADGTITLTNQQNTSLTTTVHIHVEALPRVHFEDHVHGKVFADVVATIAENALNPNKTMKTSVDWTGANLNSCEEQHEHLVGWIESSWADEHPNATHSEIAGATGYFYAAGADINVLTNNGKTFYAVWAKVE